MPRPSLIAWREHLTPAERTTVEAYEAAHAVVARLKQARAIIISRAVARARQVAARKQEGA
ncbi:hypothetical protein [Xanthobacter sediminis]